MTLEENVNQLQDALAAEYLANHADLFQQIPTVDQTDTESILKVIDMWKQYRNVLNNNPEQIQAMITGLETQLNQPMEMERQIDAAMDLETLKRNGREVAPNVDNVAVKQFGPSAISLSMALANSLGLTIECLKVQVSNEFYLSSLSVNKYVSYSISLSIHSFFYSS